MTAKPARARRGERAETRHNESVPSTGNDAVYEFGRFRLEVAERRLLRDGQPVELRAKVFDTLRVLVENHGHLVGKDQLLQAVWPDSIVEEGNLAHNLAVLRKALGEKTGGEPHIQTVPARGYRFVAEVRTVEGTVRAVAAQAADTSRAEGSWRDRLEGARAALAVALDSVSTAASSHGHVVGRRRELADMFAGLETAASGQGLVLSIPGEPGIGKTTLVARFLEELAGRHENCVVAVGCCSERLAGSEAYLPLLEALGSLLSGANGAAFAELMKMVAPTWYVQAAPLWASADPSFAAVCADAKMASRERMKRELIALFEEISRIRPFVLFVDDLHWADASTVDFLAYLSRRLASIRVLLLVVYRQSEMILGRHPFIAVQQELQKQNLCREVEIGLLSLEDVTNYLALELPREDTLRELAGFIFRRTEGNPLFMADLVRHLRERCARGEALASMEGDVPASVRSMVQRRIDQLDHDELAMLAAASVQGYEFDAGIIGNVLKLDAVTVEARLRRLDRAHSLVRYIDEKELPDGSVAVRYAFAHSLYQHAIDDTLTTSQRVALSQAAAEALLRHYGTSSPAVASQLALLFEAGRDFERAADFFVVAAGNAARLFANEEAVHLSRRAIVNADKLQGMAGQSRVLAAALQVAQLHLVLSRFADAAADFELAEKAAGAMGDIDARISAICGQALAEFTQIHLQATRQHGERALALAQTLGSEVGAASADLVLGLEQVCLGATADAQRRFGRAMPVLVRHGPPLHALEVVGYSGLLHAWQLEYKSAGDALDWCLQKARELGLSYYIILNLFVRGMARFNQGRLSEGLQDLREGMRLAEKNGERFWLSRFPNTLGWAYRELQDFEMALRYDAEGAKTARENGYGKPEANAHVNLAADYIAVGEPRRALDHLRRAGEIFESDMWFRWRYDIRTKAELARYSLARGDTGDAARHASESVALAAPRKIRKHLARAYKILGDVAVAEERFADARREYDTALRVLERHRCPTVEWTVLLAAADTASAFRDTALAEHYHGRCRQVIQLLADSLTEDSLRSRFLASEAIRRALI
jgi:DNA-binding winged helix-turn-helix (wHTH) protein/tetratricopeptide (TPR) repeat protein